MGTAIGFGGLRQVGGGGTSISNIVCSSAENTPQGVTWTSGGTTVTGALVASSSTVNNRYFVLSSKTKTKNTYKEYVTISVNSSYQWEELGNVDFDTDYIKYTTQTLTDAQKMQARKNQGLYYSEDGLVKVLEFDGVTTGKTTVSLGEGVMMVKVATNGSITAAQLSGAYIDDSTGEHVAVGAESQTDGLFCNSGKFVIANKANAVIDYGSMGEFTFPEAGVYFYYSEDVYTSKVAATTAIFDGTVYHQIESEYIPDDVMSKGSNTLTATHLLVTDSDGNVADSGKTVSDVTDIIYGFMNNSTFYLTRTGSAGSYIYSDAVTPVQGKQYTDKEGNVPYIWDGSSYDAIGGSSGVPEAPIDGKPYYRKNGAWADASVGETETVYIHFSSSDSQLTLLGLQASVSFADGSATRLLTADASGDCSTMIDVGKVYTITVADQTGYQHIASKTLKAALAERNVYFNYEKTISGSDCTITVTLTCSGGRTGDAPSWDGTSVNLSLSDNTARTATVSGGVATFSNVTRGLSGKVSCTKLSGWVTPTIANVDTTLQTIGVTMNYTRVSASGIFMVASTGDEYTYQTWDTSLTCVALHIATSALAEEGCDYYVRISDLLASNLSSRVWQTNLASSWTLLPNVHVWSASSPYYDGETDTAAMISDSAEYEETCPAAEYAITQSFTHLGVTHAGFIPTRDQFQPMVDNKDYIYNCYALATGGTATYYATTIWSASQYNAGGAWFWNGGSWGNANNKSSSRRVLPVFAI